MNQKKDLPLQEKNKTLLRWEALMPFSILFLFIFLYFYFFFDFHLKKGIEKAARSIYGAEVNIKILRTQFFNPSFTLKGLQITDKKNPSRNLIEIKKIHGRLLFDALLRFKFVIEEIGIEGVLFNSKRKIPGKVYPKKSKKESFQLLHQIEKILFIKIKEKNQKNTLLDISRTLPGLKAKENLKKMKVILDSKSKIQELTQRLRSKEKKWKQNLKDLKSQKKLQEMIRHFKKKLNSGVKNPRELIHLLKEIQEGIQLSKGKIKLTQELTQNLNQEIKNYEKEFKNLELLIQKDIQKIHDQLQIPNLKLKNISSELFEDFAKEKLFKILNLIQLGQTQWVKKGVHSLWDQSTKNEPKKEEKTRETFLRKNKQKRAQGKIYEFPKKGAYPVFWLKKGIISSKFFVKNQSRKEHQSMSELQGMVKNLSSHPLITRTSTQILLEGNFFEFEVKDFSLKNQIDFSDSSTQLSLDFKIGSYLMKDFIFSNQKTISWIIPKAKGGIEIKAFLKKGDLSVSVLQRFFEVTHSIKTNSKKLSQILKKVTKGLSEFYVKASFKVKDMNGFNLQSKITSNLGDKLSKALKEEFKKEIKKAEKEVKVFVDKKITPFKRNLKEKLNQEKQEILRTLKVNENFLLKTKKDMEGFLKQTKRKLKSQKVKKIKEKGEKILKKLGF